MIAFDALKAAVLLFFVSRSCRCRCSRPWTSSAACPTCPARDDRRGRAPARLAFGATGGFFGGLLLDTANLETLGLTSLVLTVGGYWIGRYGETTGRDRTHAPFVSVAVVTVLYAVGVLVLHFLLGDPVSARALLVESLVPTIAFNLILTAPVYWIVTKLLPPLDWRERAGEVRLLG